MKRFAETAEAVAATPGRRGISWLKTLADVRPLYKQYYAAYDAAQGETSD